MDDTLAGTSSRPRTTWRWALAAATAAGLAVAFACVWSMGLEDEPLRVGVHSIAGCLFYGAFTVKMLALRIRGLPGWVLPVLGGAVLTLPAATWVTSAFWWVTR